MSPTEAEIGAIADALMAKCKDMADILTAAAEAQFGTIPTRDEPAYASGVQAGISGTLVVLAETGLLASPAAMRKWWKAL